MKSLTPTYTYGTHRLISPEQTLSYVTPMLEECGITRCASVTGLDVDLGVPTYCAIRPKGRVLQTSSGKGLTDESAKVSALMEAIELHHAENPEPEHLRSLSLNSLCENNFYAVEPQRLPGYYDNYFSNRYVTDWVMGEELLSQQAIWVPASAVYFCEPSLYRTSTNGLASGNHLVEATLHALYELIERDAISKLDIQGRLTIRENCKVIDLMTILDNRLQNIIHKIENAESKLVLLWVPSDIPVHTFWAILLNKAPFSPMSTFNTGCGAHLDIKVAAARAVTEAIQSRLTLIHGSRDDIITKPIYRAEDTLSSPAYRYFDHLESNFSWRSIEEQVVFRSENLLDAYDYLVSEISKAGHNEIIRVNLTKPKLNIPVVKVIVPSFRFNRELF
ncbi:MAG: YcaO-like family protein [Chloroflexota bacterium]